ncbi:MAG TPA: hypothetical protein VG604_03795 [Candidatus Saccharimonadales bacterium]|nr:hypothetical protein [Candidatus Saccharimonadales bacterium]
MAESEFYTPGICNINPKEVAYRRKYAVGFGVAAVVVLILLLVFKAAPAVGLVLFLPIWLGSISELQARNHFCVSYAAAGEYNASDKFADVAKATAEQHAADQKRARKLNLQAVLSGLVGAAVCVAILAII